MDESLGWRYEMCKHCKKRVRTGERLRHLAEKHGIYSRTVKDHFDKIKVDPTDP